MMKITEITIMKRKNLGNYEHEEVSISAVLEEGADVTNCIAKVKQEVCHALGLAVDPVATPVKENKVPAKATKKPAPKKAVEAAPVEVVAEPEVKPEPKKPAPKKAKVVKLVAYNRSEATHKTEFAKVLVAVNPKWQVECAALAKQASIALEGADMLDEKGLVVESFVEKVRAAITSEDADL